MDSIDWEQCIVCQQMTDDVPHCPANSNTLSWSAFHAAEIEDSHPVAICTMLPLFQDKSKSPSYDIALYECDKTSSRSSESRPDPSRCL